MSTERIKALAVEVAQLSTEEQAEFVHDLFAPGKDLQLLISAVECVVLGPDRDEFMSRMLDVLNKVNETWDQRSKEPAGDA